MTEPPGEDDKPYDPPVTENPNIAASHPYALDAPRAFTLGTLVGLLSRALDGEYLSVSPVTDQQGNYLRLVRFTLDEPSSPSYSWVLALVVE